MTGGSSIRPGVHGTLRWILAALVSFIAGAFVPGLGIVWPGAWYAGLILSWVIAPLLAFIGAVSLWRSRAARQLHRS